MWGRMASCGRLPTRLPVFFTKAGQADRQSAAGPAYSIRSDSGLLPIGLARHPLSCRAPHSDLRGLMGKLMP